jgi:hypothetical protein
MTTTDHDPQIVQALDRLEVCLPRGAKMARSTRLVFPIAALLLFASISAGAGTACLPIVLDRPFALDPLSDETYAGYQIEPWATDLGLGDDSPDYIRFQFYDRGAGFESGTIDLTANGDDNYRTCETCIVIFQDQRESIPADKIFFQSQGTMSLDPTPPIGALGLTFKLNDVRLVEVTLDQNGSTPVPGGDCYYQAPNAIFANGFDSSAP